MKAQSASVLAPQDLKTPSLKRRMACWLYEGMLLFGVMVSSGLVYFVAAYWITGLAPGDMVIHPQLKSGLQASSFLVLGLYFIWMWRRGQTLAMKTWRIQIVDISGHPISHKAAFKRYLASWLWFIPPLAVSSAMGLPVLELTSPTCTCSTSVANVPMSSRTSCTVTRRSKSTRHHWFVPYAVIEKLALLLSVAMSAMFKSNVLDCVATHALLRAPPQDRAKLSWYGTSWYVGPLYPALQTQSQIDTAAAADALVLAHDVHAVH
jgi:uncharacterized RDD family membrane protein YckC